MARKLLEVTTLHSFTISEPIDIEESLQNNL